MGSDLVKKLCLGTAQFGLNYGIANTTGKISEEEAHKILDYACLQGIPALDTASGYGDSEEIIGKWSASRQKEMDIISKTPSLAAGGGRPLEFFCNESLRKLQIPYLYGYLVHVFEDIRRRKKLWDGMTSLKKDGLVANAGVSLYTCEQLEYLLDNNIVPDVLQVPYSVFDQRFNSYFERLKAAGVEIHARSVFLQGVCFLEPDKIKDICSFLYPACRRLGDFSRDTGIPSRAICLCFALINPFIDKVIIGVDSLRQLRENVQSLRYADGIRELEEQMRQFACTHEEALLPHKWRAERLSGRR